MSKEKLYLSIHGADIKRLMEDSKFRNTFDSIDELGFLNINTRFITLDTTNMELAKTSYKELNRISNIMETTAEYEQLFTFSPAISPYNKGYMDSIESKCRKYINEDEYPFYVFKDFTLDTNMENQPYHNHVCKSYGKVHEYRIPSMSLIQAIFMDIEKKFNILNRDEVKVSLEDMPGIMTNIVNPVIDWMICLVILKNYFESLSSIYTELAVSVESKSPLAEEHYTLFSKFFKGMRDVIGNKLDNVITKYNRSIVITLANTFTRQIMYGTVSTPYFFKVVNLVENKEYIGDLDRIDCTINYHHKSKATPIIRITIPRKNTEPAFNKLVDVEFIDLLTIDLNHIYSVVDIIFQQMFFPLIELNSVVNFSSSLSNPKNISDFKLTTLYDDFKVVKTLEILDKLQFAQTVVDTDNFNDKEVPLSISKKFEVCAPSIFDFKHYRYFFATNNSIYTTIDRNAYVSFVD